MTRLRGHQIPTEPTERDSTRRGTTDDELSELSPARPPSGVLTTLRRRPRATPELDHHGGNNDTADHDNAEVVDRSEGRAIRLRGVPGCVRRSGA